MALSSTRKYYTVVISSYVIFQQDNKVLLSRRYNTGYRDGEYSLPAGHIEEAEFATVTAMREAEEEVGAIVKPEDLAPAHVMHRHCGDHERIDFFFTTARWTGELTNKEPDKCDEINWFTLDQLPSNIIPYIRAALEHYRDKHFFSEFTELNNIIFKK
ncbi:MAG: NUDIX domain-containing protein [Candidatus Andersenbacteria bacterium]